MWNRVVVLFLLLSGPLVFGFQFQYIIGNDCPEQFHYLESTYVQSNCDVTFGAGNLTYTLTDQDGGDREAAVTVEGECAALTLFELAITTYNNLLFLDISNIDGFTAGLNVSGFYQDGSVKNIHCCSGCPNTTDSPNCWGAGNYWFPTEISGYGTTAWSANNLTTLFIQFSCLSTSDLHACDGIQCLNDGVCMGGMRAEDGVSGICLCQPGYTGSDCSIKSDYTPCYGVNCGYYGVCNATTASAGGNKCTCLDGYTGATCTDPPSTSNCYEVDCGPRGICKNGQCQCEAGSSGCACSTLGSCTITENLDYQGNDLTDGTYTFNTPQECCAQCQKTPLCYAFTFTGNQCYLKSAVPEGGGSTVNGKYSGYLPTNNTMDSCVVKTTPTPTTISGSNSLPSLLNYAKILSISFMIYFIL